MLDCLRLGGRLEAGERLVLGGTKQLPAGRGEVAAGAATGGADTDQTKIFKQSLSR
jgi:hypothetical protein